MFAIQIYKFLIGTKIPFTDYPGIVQKFFEQESLHYDRFLYYFQDLRDNYPGLTRIMKDCPNIGLIHSRPYYSTTRFYLSNIEENTDCTEAEIVSVVPKIFRRYGITESYLIYEGIDFFGQKIPSIICATRNNPECIKGSSITLYRDSIFPKMSGIELSIVINDGKNTYNPVPYFDAMKRLLPGIRHRESMECCMSSEEQVMYDDLNQQATALIENINACFKKLLPAPSSEQHWISPPNLSVAPMLKIFCKQFGYSYLKPHFCVFSAQKRTKNKHYIKFDILVGPEHKGVDFIIEYVGAGFEHRLGSTYFYPTDQADLESLLQKCFQALLSVEKDVLSELDSHYPPTPDWFAPTN